MQITKCPHCNKKFSLFRWKYQCQSCSHQCCDDCLTTSELPYEIDTNYQQNLDNFQEFLPKKKICPSCKNKQQDLDVKYSQAVTNLDKVECFSKNYKGKIDIALDEAHIALESYWFKNKDECFKQLKINAYILSCNIIYDYEFVQSTASNWVKNPNYKFTVWKLRGKIAKKLN